MVNFVNALQEVIGIEKVSAETFLKNEGVSCMVFGIAVQESFALSQSEKVSLGLEFAAKQGIVNLVNPKVFEQEVRRFLLKIWSPLSRDAHEALAEVRPREIVRLVGKAADVIERRYGLCWGSTPDEDWPEKIKLLQKEIA